MTELRELLAEKGVQKVVIIDDVFDDEPRPEELNDGDWTIFFDDLQEKEHELLSELYNKYKDKQADKLKLDQEFVTLLWQNREKLPKIALFREYEETKANERSGLDTLLSSLENLGLSCLKMGRAFDERAKEADLIFVDLFLGFQQSDGDMKQAIRRISSLVTDRSNNPPLVILMSRSHRLREKRNEFRDNAGLLGSTFRVVSKADLGKVGVLETILLRLTLHYEDAKRVAGFVHAWDNGLNQAREKFIRILRRLDLSDLAQIRALLLKFEGEDLGEYLLDVADRVLQHEIEDDDETIAAALELNKIDLNKYPASHLTGTPDLQDLVHRMVFLHNDRLQLSEKNGIPVLNFGDVLRWKKEDEDAFSNEVSLVVTPACDLARGGVERVMLLSGSLEELQPKNWSYKEGEVKTAIIILPNEGRRWIKWNLKDVRMLSWGKLDSFLGKDECMSRIGRLREVYAIEIQQALLADIGRIGQIANMPVSFPVSVSLFYVNSNRKAERIGIEDIEAAACYVGRDEDSKPVHRLILAEQDCDQIRQSVQALNTDDVSSSAKQSVASVKEDQGFLTRFERGEIDMSTENGIKYIKGTENKIYAAIIRGGEFEEGGTVTGNTGKAALILKVTDILDKDGNG